MSSAQSDRSRSRVVIDVSILAVSVVALIGASTSGALSSHSNPVAAAAPAVVALGTSVIAIRIVEYLCRRLSTVTHDSSAVASFLAVSRIGRRPTVLREGRTLVIAVGLACFAVCAWSVARANRLTAATFSTGARTVVTVTADDLQLDQAVNTVDPHGRFAMAAVEINTSSTSLIGVDASAPGGRRRLAGWDDARERRRGRSRVDPENRLRRHSRQRRVGRLGRCVGLRGGESGSGAPRPRGVAVRSGARVAHRRPREVAPRQGYLPGRPAGGLPVPPDRHRRAPQRQAGAELWSHSARSRRADLPPWAGRAAERAGRAHPDGLAPEPGRRPCHRKRVQGWVSTFRWRRWPPTSAPTRAPLRPRSSGRRRCSPRSAGVRSSSKGERWPNRASTATRSRCVG